MAVEELVGGGEIKVAGQVRLSVGGERVLHGVGARSKAGFTISIFNAKIIFLQNNKSNNTALGKYFIENLIHPTPMFPLNEDQINGFLLSPF